MTSPRPTGHPWTLAEDKQLQTLLDSGMKVAAIAQKMKHTVGAIHSRKSILRKALRVQEAHEAIADHEDAQKAFHENRERLREERLARETAAGPMLYPAPEIPDDTLIDNVRFSTRIRSALNAAGLKTVGEIREASDATLLSFRDLGAGSIARLRETLGLPPARALRPKGKKPT